MGKHKSHTFLPEEKLFIYAFIKGRSRKDVTALFNAHFGLTLTVSQIGRLINRHGWKNGLDTRFQPGHSPVNKGLKGVGGHAPTYFKKGHRPVNAKSVGTERVTRDNYVEVKIAEPKTWRAKHIIIWEAANGKIPEKHVILFGDGDKRNFDLDNLILVTRGQLATLNKKGLIQDNAEATRTALAIVDLYQKISKLKKR